MEGKALQTQRGTAVSDEMSEIERDSALRLWRELSCDWSGPSVLAHCSQGFRVRGRQLYSLCSVVSLLVSALLVVGARSTRDDDDRATNTIVTDMVSPVSLMEEATGTCQNREISPSDLFRLSHRAQQDQLYNGLLLQRLCSLQPVLTCE